MYDWRVRQLDSNLLQQAGNVLELCVPYVVYCSHAAFKNHDEHNDVVPTCVVVLAPCPNCAP